MTGAKRRRADREKDRTGKEWEAKKRHAHILCMSMRAVLFEHCHAFVLPAYVLPVSRPAGH
eukprot:1143089-Pelagomonas_calceolata.AAC.4